MKDPFFYTRKREKLSNKFWFQFLIMPFGGVVVLVTLGLLLEPLGNILVKVPVVGVGFEKLCRVVNAPCGVREPDPTYLVNDEAEPFFQNASLSDRDKQWLQDKAIEYREALMRNKKNAAAWKSLGEVLRRLGQPEQSLESLQKALEIEPNSEQTLIFLAKTQRDLGNIEEADQALQIALQINPSNKIALKMSQKVKYFCGVSNGVPTTIVKIARREIPLIHWVSDFKDGWTPQQRCQRITAIFQEEDDNGTLNYLTTEVKDGLPVICVAEKIGGGCSRSLLTFKPGTDAKYANKVLESLLNLQVDTISAAMRE